MDTISINAEALNEKEEKKGKKKISDTVKAAGITGVAGVAAGAAVSAIIENIPEDAAVEIAEATSAVEEIIEENAPDVADGHISEINPDDVMLEDSSEQELIAEAVQPQDGKHDPYQPFANNDNIGETHGEMLADEVMLSENEVTISDEDAVDLICGLPGESDSLEEPTAHVDDFLADAGADMPDSIQNDLMA